MVLICYFQHTGKRIYHAMLHLLTATNHEPDLAKLSWPAHDSNSLSCPNLPRSVAGQAFGLSR